MNAIEIYIESEKDHRNVRIILIEISNNLISLIFFLIIEIHLTQKVLKSNLIKTTNHIRRHEKKGSQTQILSNSIVLESSQQRDVFIEKSKW
jgi:hypothetical protein